MTNPKNGRVLPHAMEVQNLSAWYGSAQAIRNVSLHIPPQSITAIIGPSGCGKSTLIRCLNRMHELVSGTKTSGSVLLDGVEIYSRKVDPVKVRRRVGMVFQKPNPFPTMSVYDNVAAGLKLNGVRDQQKLDHAVVTSLKRAALWDEVKDDLDNSGVSL